MGKGEVGGKGQKIKIIGKTKENKQEIEVGIGMGVGEDNRIGFQEGVKFIVYAFFNQRQIMITNF